MSGDEKTQGPQGDHLGAADDLRLPEGLALPLDADLGPATPLSAASADALVRGALEGWQPVPVAAAPKPPSQLFRFAAAAAAVVTLATVGTAAALLWWRPGAAPQAALPSDAAPQLEPPHTEEAPELAPPPYAAEVEPIATPELIEPTEVVTPPDTRPRARPAREAPADDLLAEANALRGAGRFREAEALYERVARSERGAFTGYVAEVAAAGVRVEHLRDARGALAGYRRALAARPGGPLDAEARQGEARALRMLGDRAGETRALETLVSAHPSSAQARRARSRLEELSESGPR